MTVTVLVSLDTVSSGMVPAKVVGWKQIPHDGGERVEVRLTVQVTADRRGYSRGQTVSDCSTTWTAPRHTIRACRMNPCRHNYTVWSGPEWIEHLRVAGIPEIVA